MNGDIFSQGLCAQQQPTQCNYSTPKEDTKSNNKQCDSSNQLEIFGHLATCGPYALEYRTQIIKLTANRTPILTLLKSMVYNIDDSAIFLCDRASSLN